MHKFFTWITIQMEASILYYYPLWHVPFDICKPYHTIFLQFLFTKFVTFARGHGVLWFWLLQTLEIRWSPLCNDQNISCLSSLFLQPTCSSLAVILNHLTWALIQKIYFHTFWRFTDLNRSCSYVGVLQLFNKISTCKLPFRAYYIKILEVCDMAQTCKWPNNYSLYNLQRGVVPENVFNFKCT